MQGMMGNQVSDEMLLGQLAHCSEALEELYRRWGRRWAGLVSAAGVPDADVADVIQQILVEVWRHAKRFDARRGSAEAWLLQIARFRTIDYLRRIGRRSWVALEETLESQDGATVTVDEQMMVEKALQQLTVRERRLLELTYYYGFTQREIAQLWHVPLGTIKSRTTRALARLRQDFNGEGG